MRRSHGFRLVCLSVGCLALLGVPARAATLVVDLSGASDFTEIQPAIDAAQAGDTVLVRAGEYVVTQPIDFKGKAITVRSEAGAEATTIRLSEPRGNHNVVSFYSGETATANLDGFKLIGGRAPLESGCQCYFGGVWCTHGSSPAITNCVISGNSGGVNCFDSSAPKLDNCVISGNSGSGVDCFDSFATLTNCTISDNTGFGVSYNNPKFSTVTLTVASCTISGNSRGGISSGYSALTLTNCIVWDNCGEAIVFRESFEPNVSFSCIQSADVWPGTGNTQADPKFCGWVVPVVWVDANLVGPGSGTQADPYSSLSLALGAYRLSLKQCSPCRGTGKDGVDMGAPWGTCEGDGSASRLVNLAPGSYPIVGSSLVHQVSLEGAGQKTTVIEGTVYGLRTGQVLSGVKVTSGREEGGIVTRGEGPEIRFCTISGNWGLSQFGGPGAVSCFNSSPTLTNCTIAGNLSNAGVYCEQSSPTLTNCTISGNMALSTASAGVYCQLSSPTLTNCTISGNEGSGARFFYSSSTLTNCTILGNSEYGVQSQVGGGTKLTNCTISANSRSGLLCGQGSPTLTNCIFWDNAGGSVVLETECSPIFSYSCVEGGWAGAGNIDQDPGFVDGDYRLQPGSPCIDTGTCDGAPPLDIEGNPRPSGPGCDMGAYEYVPPPPPLPEFTGAGFSPTQGPQGSKITITGIHFTGATAVLLNGVSAAFTITSDVRIDATVPPNATTGPITVITPAGQATSANQFVVLPLFRRADTNADAKADMSDAATTLGFLFLGNPSQLACDKSADTNDDGKIDLSDPVALLNHLFLGAPAPPAPFGECGVDPTVDGLGCEAFGPCV